jgi:molecular chaperone IbpA
MATFDVSPLFRTTSVGFERPRDHWQTALNFDSAGYPAYDILKVADDEFRISLAVPGLTHDDITIETREGAVWVKGGRKVDPNHNQYLYKGIGLDGFQRTFQLPEHVHVKGARLEMGLLHIELVRELPEEMRPRRIEISSDTPSQSVLEDASKAA